MEKWGGMCISNGLRFAFPISIINSYHKFKSYEEKFFCFEPSVALMPLGALLSVLCTLCLCPKGGKSRKTFI